MRRAPYLEGRNSKMPPVKTTLKLLPLLVFVDLHPHGRIYSVFMGTVCLIGAGLVLLFSQTEKLVFIGGILALIGLLFYIIVLFLVDTATKSGQEVRWLSPTSQLLVLVIATAGLYSWITFGLSLLAAISLLIMHLIVIWHVNQKEILKLIGCTARE